MKRNLKIVLAWIAFFETLSLSIARADVDVAATVGALRLSNTITGGYLSSSDPLFTQMVTKIQSGDIRGAAQIAAYSKHFASYLGRRLAFQMQNPSFDAVNGIDNDATAFVLAHFIGAGDSQPSISKLWSDNATYLVKPAASGANIHAADLTAAQLKDLDWDVALKVVMGQTTKVVTASNGTTVTTAPGPIPEKHVGGFLTLSDRRNDSSFAMYGATAGTNLRMIEGMWQIATGLTLVDTQSAAAGRAYMVPRFIPENDPNFFHGQGQTACIACHGGGMSSLQHGYSTVADVFNFDGNQGGLMYIPTPTTVLRKSLGSDSKMRAENLACDLKKTPKAVCNPDSAGAYPNQSWDLSVWKMTGVLETMGWNGPLVGQGLNSLGAALGKATIVYKFLTQRVIGEVCPLGMFTASDLKKIVDAVDPLAAPAGTDDVRTIVAMVASHPSCQ
jgi:hypothetical protein